VIHVPSGLSVGAFSSGKQAFLAAVSLEELDVPWEKGLLEIEDSLKKNLAKIKDLVSYFSANKNER